MFSLEQYRALREGAGLVDRSPRGRLRLTGPDRREYLQGLLTNDIAALVPGAGCYAALLTAQGRMISDMYVIETGEAILMDLERDVTAKVAAHLEQFIFSEDVQVGDESDVLSQIGIFGPAAADVVSRALDLEPESSQLKAMHPLDNRIATAAGTRAMVVRRDDIGAAGFDLLLQNASAGAVADALRLAGAVDVDREAVEVVRVEAGRPVFHQDMDEATIPLEAGIEDRAISLTKGCYVGQEIIIRVLHRGQGRVARHLTGLALEPSAGVPAHGDRIRSGDREIGTVTSAVRSVLLQRPLALGYVHRDFVEPSTAVTIVSGGIGLPAIVTALPLSGAE